MYVILDSVCAMNHSLWVNKNWTEIFINYPSVGTSASVGN